MIYLITRVAGMIVCRYNVLGKEKGVQEFLPKCLNTIPLLQTCHHPHDILAAVRIAYAACTLHHRPTVTAAPMANVTNFGCSLFDVCVTEREGGIGSRADGHEGREIKWGGYLAGRKNGTRREEEEGEEGRAVTDSTASERDRLVSRLYRHDAGRPKGRVN